LTLPDGTTSAVSPTAIEFGNSTGFKIHVVLPTAGSYSVRVTNPSGLSSASFGFDVAAPAAPATPTVTGTSPQTPTAGTALQGVYVAGTGFQTGLTVTLTAPDGTSTTASGSSIVVGSSVIFKMTVVLPIAGNYTIVVNNPTGPSSSVATMTVKAAF
jgi:hypothetical protein